MDFDALTERKQKTLLDITIDQSGGEMCMWNTQRPLAPKIVAEKDSSYALHDLERVGRRSKFKNTRL